MATATTATRLACGVGVFTSAVLLLRLRLTRHVLSPWLNSLSKRLALALQPPEPPASFVIVAPDYFARKLTPSRQGPTLRHFATLRDWKAFLDDVNFESTVPAGKQ